MASRISASQVRYPNFHLHTSSFTSLHFAVLHSSCFCIIVAQLSYNSSSPFFQSLRVGESARLKNMYQDDYLRRFLKEHMSESQLVGAMIDSLDESIAELLRVAGPATEGQRRRSLVVLVANNGVMDFVMNFACSCRAAGVATGNIVVYVGSRDSVKLVSAMGLRAIFSPALGGMPEGAANNYGDDSFASMMWLKVTAVYTALAAGFHVLFQDTGESPPHLP